MLRSSASDNSKQNNEISKTLESPVFSRVFFMLVFSGIFVLIIRCSSSQLMVELENQPIVPSKKMLIMYDKTRR